MHASINKFVVYEKFAEQSNKYDVGNFAKIIDEFDIGQEIEAVRSTVGVKVVAVLPEGEGALTEKTTSVNNSSLNETDASIDTPKLEK